MEMISPEVVSKNMAVRWTGDAGDGKDLCNRMFSVGRERRRRGRSASASPSSE